MSLHQLGISGSRPTPVNADVAILRPTELLKSLPKRRVAVLSFPVVLGKRLEHADAPHAVGLLRARRVRPRGRGATEQRNEIASSDHSITSSAAARSVGGTV